MTLGARSLTFGYRPGVAALREVSLELMAGSVTAIIGPNGAGKSTLLRLLTGARAPWSGEVLLNDRAMKMYSARARAAHVAYVSQRPAIAGPYLVEQVIQLGRYALPRDEAAVESAIEAMELEPLRRRPMLELSVGQQQRAAIARAMAQLGAGAKATEADDSLNGKALLADEPIAAMDPRHAILTMRQMRAMAQRGAAVALVLHDLTAALNWTDRAVLLDHETVVAAGATTDVVTPERLGPVYGAGFETTSGGRARAIVAMDAMDRSIEGGSSDHAGNGRGG